MNALSIHDALFLLRPEFAPNPNLIPVDGIGRERKLIKNGQEVLVNTAKRPGTFRHFIAWKELQSRCMTREDYYSLFRHDDPFDAVGIISGPNQWRCFDFDGCAHDAPLYDMLELLGLPDDYAWVVESGSKAGFHVWFRAADLPQQHGLPSKKGDKGIYSGKSRYGDFDHLELRYFGCQTLIPPSAHKSGNRYEFFFDAPEQAPMWIDTRGIIDAFFAMTQETPIIHREQAKQTGGNPLFESLKNTVTPEAVFVALGWNYYEESGNYVGECPLHESTSGTPFRWHIEQGFYKCFHAGCGETGDIVSMVALFKGYNTKDKMYLAAKWLQETFHLDFF